MQFACQSESGATPGASKVLPVKGQRLALWQLHHHLSNELREAATREAALTAAEHLLAKASGCVGLVYFGRGAENRLLPLATSAFEELCGALQVEPQKWLGWCEDAAKKEKILWQLTTGDVRSIVFAVPVGQDDSSAEALSCVFSDEVKPSEPLLLTLQLVAIHLAMWEAGQRSRDAENESRTLAALLEVIAKIESADAPQHAALTVVNELQSYLGCDRIALGTIQSRSTGCRVEALSGTSKFDRRSSYVRLLEATMDEALVQDDVTVWPPCDPANRQAVAVHEKLCAAAGVEAVVSSPLRDHRGELIGAWLLLGSREFAHGCETVSFVETAQRSIGSSLECLREAKSGPATRLIRSIKKSCAPAWLRWTVGIAALLLAAMFIPLPYRLACDCVIEPVTRRIVVAPFDGRLAKTNVEPGDLVQADDLLAQMDGREIRWELAGLEADFNRARKEKDAALAERKMAAAQIAKLEMDGFALKMQLLEYRTQQLDVRSPIDGIIVAGDLERVEGAPMTIGQTLFEVAPLDQMIVEVAIPEYEVAYFAEGMTVEVRLDAYPGQTWDGTLKRIHPRSEIREQQSVFIAELELDNPDGTLRPGMNGQAKIVGPRRALGWIYFHRPYEVIVQKLGGKMAVGDETIREDFRVRELGNSVLRLRGDLVFAPQTTAGKTGYMIEDPINSKFYRIGLAEYHFLSLLDGETTVREALSRTATARPSDGLTEQAAAQLCRWLIQMDLAHTNESSCADRLHSAANTASRRQTASRANPIIIRLPLLRPERLLAAIYPWCGWLFSLPMFLAWCGLLGFAIYRLTADSDRFWNSSAGVFSPHNYVGILACWLFLKVVHEIGHGIACRKYGGYVREAGIVLILFLPIAYVDVSSAWRFRSKWQRIITAAAGMYIELMMAALAAVVWSYTKAGPLNQLCTNFVLMASVTTLLFNANALMRFDGYYMLADWLEIPNLYTSGQQYLRSFGRRVFLGVKSSPLPWPARTARIIKVYGWASLAWRIFICMALTVGAAALFHGAGIIVAVLAMVGWVAIPLVKFGRYLVIGDELSQPNRIRFALVAGGSLAVATALLLGVPWPLAKRAPAIVQYEPLSVVRAGSPGSVRELYVRGGQFVESGDLLARLENQELQVELADLDLAIARSELKSRGHRNRQEMAACQAEAKNAEGLRKQRAEKQAQTERLIVRAPARGKVIGRGLDALRGTYLEEGDEILSIGDECSKEMKVSVAQEDVDAFGSAIDKLVRVRISGVVPFNYKLTKLDPRANSQPPHPALIATNGGPLVVQQTDDDTDDDEDAKLELLTPRFIATISLDAEHSERVACGQRGTVRLRCFDESIGQHLYTAVVRWIRERLEAGG